MNEFEFINKLRRRVENTNSSSSSFIVHPSSLVRGIGDDAAAFKSPAGTDVVISTDLLVEDIDFRRDTTRPELLGHKALAVSLSDIAAMGARPRWALLSVGVPQDVWNSGFVNGFYDGLFKLAARYGVTLIGGDVSRTPDKIVIDSIVIGECLTDREVFRSGAAPGDQIFVTGFLGDAAAGLRLIERGARLHAPAAKTAPASVGSSAGDVSARSVGDASSVGDANANSPDDASARSVDDASSVDASDTLANDATERHPIDHLLRRQLRPEPRVGWGLLLGEQQLATAMIDVSDGLSSDLNHLCAESKVGALIDAAKIPIDHLVTELCGRRALDPLMLALHGGEDFELLFTVKPENAAKLPKRVDGVSITRIGEITNEPNKIRVVEKDRVWDLAPGGFEHFKSKA